MTMDHSKLRVTGRIEEVTLEYKVLVLGCSQVGKSSLIGRYTTGKFRSAMMSTVGKRPAASFIIFSLCLNILSMHWRPELRDIIVKFGFAPLSQWCEPKFYYSEQQQNRLYKALSLSSCGFSSQMHYTGPP